MALTVLSTRHGPMEIQSHLIGTDRLGVLGRYVNRPGEIGRKHMAGAAYAAPAGDIPLFTTG